MPEMDIEVTVEAVFLTSGEPSGKFRVKVSPNASVETLLRVLCHEANTPCKVDYCLQSKAKSTLSRVDILSDVGVGDGGYLVWTSQDFDDKRWSCGCNTFWFVSLLALVMGIAILVTICVIRYKEKHPVTDYAIVFDAGSSHTAMFVYKWEGSKFNGTAMAEQLGKKCSSPGGAISKYTSDPFAAGKSLEFCIKKAKAAIPKDRHAKTPIYLGATAGMRLLREKDPIVSEAILESIRKTFGQSSFKVSDPKHNVQIIDGDEEGTLSWITSNYVTNSFKVLDHLPENDAKTMPFVIVSSLGALDLGGASTQITFIPEEPSSIPGNFSTSTVLFDTNYTLYTHSYMCFGVNEARRRTLAALVKESSNSSEIFHPCLPSGYSVTKTHDDIFGSPCVSGQSGLESFGSVITPPGQDADVTNKTYTFKGESYPVQCMNLVTTSLFDFEAPCPYTRCSFNGVYQPPISGPFYAFSTFSLVMDFLNLTHSQSHPNKDYITYDEFLYALNSLCMMSWDQVKTLPDEEKYLAAFCEEANYIHRLLGQGYGFTNTSWQDIHFVKKIFNTEIGWTLGFVLDKSSSYPSHRPEVTMYRLTFYLLLTLAVMFILVAIGFGVHAIRERKSGGRMAAKYRPLGTYGAI